MVFFRNLSLSGNLFFLFFLVQQVCPSAHALKDSPAHPPGFCHHSRIVSPAVAGAPGGSSSVPVLKNARAVNFSSWIYFHNLSYVDKLEKKVLGEGWGDAKSGTHWPGQVNDYSRNLGWPGRVSTTAVWLFFREQIRDTTLAGAGQR